MERQGEDELGCAEPQGRLREWQNQVRDTVATTILARGSLTSIYKGPAVVFPHAERPLL